MKKAQASLEKGDFDEAIELFNKIGSVCIELGDHSLGIEFQSKT